MKKIKTILFLAILLPCSGCVGYLNGYMACPIDDPKVSEIRSSYFPAVNSDTAVLERYYQNEKVNILQKTIFTIIIGVDYPISFCVDTLFLPLRGIPVTIQKYKKRNSNQEDAQDSLQSP